ncbi:MAG TPA: right-handed parallel beta-helix repeat-containing protein [Herpetosiphonaceae bacterium]
MIGALGALIILAACGALDEADIRLAMKDNTFGPQVVRVPVGGTLQIENEGRNPHNVYAVDSSWSTAASFGSVAMPPGAATRITFDRAGRYPFYCSFHATADGRRGMVGVLIVGDAIGETLETDERATPRQAASGGVRRVPEQYPAIQDAIDAAVPGDLILIGPGIYHEQVTVTTPSLVIRGTDRNLVILDGEFQRVNGIEVLAADGVAVENITARNYLLNGFYWTGVTGYRGSYLTAYNNGDYGVYAFDSVDGVFDHSYASGSPDSGFYIGQCYPCKAVINDVIAEHNALGYSGTNAGGDLYIVRSIWRNNMAGIVPNSLDTELNPPERETTIVANLIENNNNIAAPTHPLQYPALGNGIVLAGGVGNVVARNVIVDHARHGVMVAPNIDRNLWFASDNRVEDNIIRGSGRADLALAGPAGSGNCFSGNQARQTMPPGLELLHGCADLRLPLGGDLSTTTETLGFVAQAKRGDYPHNEVQRQPVPPPQPPLPGGADAPVRPAHQVFASYDEVDLRNLASLEPPAAAQELASTQPQEVVVAGLTVTQPGFWQLLFGLYGYVLPFILLAAWVSLAFWDLARQETIGRGRALAWVAIILLVPFLGVIAYHAFGGAKIAGWLRAAIVGGGLLAYLLIVGIGLAIGGVF